jgi:hypothetical protein
MISSSPTLEQIILTLFAFLIIYLLNWRFSGEKVVSIIIFILMIQWLQSVIKVLYADIIYQNMANYFKTPSEYQATYISLICVFALGVGIYFGKEWRRGKKEDDELDISPLKAISFKTLFRIYLGTVLFDVLFEGKLFAFPGLSQVGFFISLLPYVAAFLVIVYVLYYKENRWALYIIILFEVAKGFIGYFSSFKTIFFVIIMASIVLQGGKFNYKLALRYLPFLAVLIVLILFWQSIKGDYREALNKGQHSQSVDISMSERYNLLKEDLEQTTFANLLASVEMTMDRVSYTELFGDVLDNVPKRVPYENGSLLIKAVTNTLVPRIFDKSKGELDDSKDTRYYSGVHVATGEEGVSIGMGYISYMYIDFGYGAILEAFIIGLIIGFIIRVFINKFGSNIITLAFLIPIMLSIMFVETSLPKTIGWIVSNSILSYICAKIYLRHYFGKSYQEVIS